jgi:pantoate--beta-alanine ligase
VTADPIPIVDSIADMATLARRWRAAGEVIGFVPTMGALHAGHLSLVTAAKARCSRVVASIFVNPLQFGKNEDFSRYPRDLAADRDLLSTVGCDAIFTPGAADMYPEGFATSIANPRLAARFEGAARPGHFDGVLTVVAKLFNIVGPDVAFFGRKDAQQALIVRAMVRDLAVPVAIEVCPIVRETDGLAMSSRNVYLTPGGRVAARSISRGLRAAAAAFESGERNAARLQALVAAELARETGVAAEYVALVDAMTLADVDSVVRESALLVVARVDGTRLLDNLALFPASGSAAL